MQYTIDIPENSWMAGVLADQARLQKMRKDQREYEKKQYAARQEEAARLVAKGAKIEQSVKMPHDVWMEHSKFRQEISSLKYRNEIMSRELRELRIDCSNVEHQLKYPGGKTPADALLNQKEELDAKIATIEAEIAANERRIRKAEKGVQACLAKGEKYYIY